VSANVEASSRPRTGRSARGRVLGALALLLVWAGCDPAEEPVTRPRPVSLESPFRYPVALWDAGETGETLLMIRVSEVGAVDSVYVLESSGHAAFDSAAVAGARELEFAPGRRGDDRVAMWTRLPVRFRRDDPETGAPQ
jgi:TonB family protein